MRGLNPDRNPCVQGSIRSLGFNFTDWFAPFFSVRILTRKVASAEPLYCIAGNVVRRTRVDSETFWSAERVRLHHQHTPYSRCQVMEFWFCSKQKKKKKGAQSCPTLHLVLYSTNNSLLNWPTKCYPLCRAYLCELLNWLPRLSIVEVSITFKHFLAQKSSRHDLFDCRSVKKARLRWRTNFDVPLDNLKVGLPSSTKSSSTGERDLFIKRLGLSLEETPHGCRLRWGEEAHFLALPFQGEQSRSFENKSWQMKRLGENHEHPLGYCAMGMTQTMT